MRRTEATNRIARAWTLAFAGCLAVGLLAPSVAHGAFAFDSTLGGLGSGAGQLGQPLDIASDGSNVYVADRDNERVVKFTAAGEFERAWGRDVAPEGAPGDTATDRAETCTTICQAGAIGTLGGEFRGPSGIGADVTGNVYVTEFLNDRVQVFNSSGVFQTMWGKDVLVNGGGNTGPEICAVAANCKAGVEGAEAGEFDDPGGVSPDGSGNVFVVEQFNHRVQKFDSTAVFQTMWGRNVNEAGGSGFETCIGPPLANCKAGESGGLAGELNGPLGIGSDGSGSVYVADNQNHRVQKYSASGAFQRTWGRDVIDNGPGNTGFEVCTAAGDCKEGIQGGGAGAFFSPTGVTPDAAGGNVYVADFANNRAQHFTSLGAFRKAWGKDVIDNGAGNTGFEVCEVAASCKAGAQGGGNGEFKFANAIAPDAFGNGYVCDRDNDRIQKFSDVASSPPPSPPPDSDGGGGDGGGAPVVEPSNAFEIVKLKRKKLTLNVPGPGEVDVRDAADTSAGRASAAATKKRLKHSSATAAAAGEVTVRLRLKRKANEKLKEKGKVKVKAAITFTPTGGDANTDNARLTVKKRRR